MAIAYTGPKSPSVEVGDTTRLSAVPLDASGDTVTTAQVHWAVLELDTVRVGFTIDSTSGLVTGVAPGAWRVQGIVETLRTDSIVVRVTARPDSLALGGPAIDTIAASATESAPLATVLLDLTTDPGTIDSIANKPVIYRLLTSAPGLAIAPAGGAIGGDSSMAVDSTNTSGTASVTLRLAQPTTLDSAVVEATALTARGDTVPGSPVRFIIVFTTS